MAYERVVTAKEGEHGATMGSPIEDVATAEHGESLPGPSGGPTMSGGQNTWRLVLSPRGRGAGGWHDALGASSGIESGADDRRLSTAGRGTR